MNNRVITLAALLLVVSLLCGGCAGSGSGTLSQTQALDLTADIFDALAETPYVGNKQVPADVVKSAVNHLRTTKLGEPGEPLEPLHFALDPRTTSSLGSYTYTCPKGGTIVVTGSYSETATTVSENVVETINACQDAGVTMNGAPNVTVSGNYNFSNSSSLSYNETISGGFTYSGHTCSINVTFLLTENANTYAYSENVTGSVCGVSVTGSYSGTA